MQVRRRVRVHHWALLGVVTGASGLAAVPAVHAAPANDSTTTTPDAAASMSTVEGGVTALTAPDQTSMAAATEADVGTGVAPVPAPDAVASHGPSVAQAGPLATQAERAANTLPTTGQGAGLEFASSGAALAVIGAALLRLRRKPAC